MAKEQNHAKEQAATKLESVLTLIKRFKHCQECEDPTCGISDKDILEGTNLYYWLGQTASLEARQKYHDQEKAKQAIIEDSLEVKIMKKYKILLCWGGPAVRVIGDLNQYSVPETATLQ